MKVASAFHPHYQTDQFLYILDSALRNGQVDPASKKALPFFINPSENFSQTQVESHEVAISHHPIPKQIISINMILCRPGSIYHVYVDPVSKEVVLHLITVDLTISPRPRKVAKKVAIFQTLQSQVSSFSPISYYVLQVTSIIVLIQYPGR